VNGFFKRARSFDLEGELRADRPRPRPDFLSSLATEIRGERRQSRSSSFRIAFAAGLSALILVAMAALGGLGYAAKGGKSDQVTPAQNQYKFTLCHRPPGNPSNARTITVGSEQAVEAHMRNHPGDTPGACP
jgi:hypothetical protein